MCEQEAKITQSQAPTPLTNSVELRKTDPKIAQNQYKNSNYVAVKIEKQQQHEEKKNKSLFCGVRSEGEPNIWFVCYEYVSHF